jgi:protein-L-isoaspartate(D-aspartate) O-methyltransferase
MKRWCKGRIQMVNWRKGTEDNSGNIEDKWYDQRREMVDTQLIPRGIKDPAVLAAMVEVPRHEFVPNDMQGYAYRDGPLPIGLGQTISQPYIVALMAQAAKLTPDSRVLEIGTGSGYSAAVLSRIAKSVYTVERHHELARQAGRRFECLNYSNIRVRVGDGTKGWPEKVPFDRIIVTARTPVVPQTLMEQLAPGGYMVVPVGGENLQTLFQLYKNKDGSIVREDLGSVRFVPLVWEEG